jgi:hypothetical protein
LNAHAHSYTTPGSYKMGMPGSCPDADVSALATLVSRLQTAVRSGSGLCDAIAPNYRENAKRWARQQAVTCDQAVLNAANPHASEELLQPGLRIQLLELSSKPTPSGGFITFFTPSRATSQSRNDQRAINVRVEKGGDGVWQVVQIGYQF